MLKRNLIWIFSLIFFFSAFAVYSFLAPDPADEATEDQPRYRVGDKVYDLDGNLWIYKGNFSITLGQVSKDLKIVTLFVCDKEKKVHSIHLEKIPNSAVGDTFLLITPGLKLQAQIDIQGGDPPQNGQERCNVTVSCYGGLCCMYLSCED